MKKNLQRRGGLVLALLVMFQTLSFAQIAFDNVTWVKKDVDFKIQLERDNPQTYNPATFWKEDIVSGQELSDMYCKYKYTGSKTDYTNGVHEFTLNSNTNALRAEAKVEYNYKTDGIYQMEGKLQFTNGVISPKHICQIWQDIAGDKIFIYRTSTDNNGTLYMPTAEQRTVIVSKRMTNINNYNNSTNQWIKVNWVHFRKERMVYVYLNDVLYVQFSHIVPTDTEYYFKFGAYGKIDGHSGEQAKSTWKDIKFFEGTAGITPPSNLTAQAVSPTQVNLTWQDNSANEDSFYIERAYTSDFANVTYTKKVGANVETATNSGLKPLTTYYYRVKAKNASEISAPSNWVAVTTPADNIILEAESATLTSPMKTVSDASASGGSYIVTTGYNSTTTAPATGRAVLTFNALGGTYKIWGCTLFAGGGDNSFWVKVDNGAWVAWNDDAAISTAWKWNVINSSITLTAGTHTLSFAYREDNSKLDRIVISNDPAYDPSVTLKSQTIAPLANVNFDFNVLTNTNSSETKVSYTLAQNAFTNIVVYNLQGKLMQTLVNEQQPAGAYSKSISTSGLTTGVYIVKMVSGTNSAAQKFIVR